MTTIDKLLSIIGNLAEAVEILAVDPTSRIHKNGAIALAKTVEDAVIEMQKQAELLESKK